MTSKRGWEEAAAELGLDVGEMSDFGMPTVLRGTIGPFRVEAAHDSESVRDTKARIEVSIPRRLSSAVFTVGPYAPPGTGKPAFYKPTITGDPRFNIRFSIEVTPEHRDGALEYLSPGRRSLLMSLQSVTPQLAFRSDPEGASLISWTDRRPSGDSLIRIVRAQVRVAEALYAEAPDVGVG